MSTAISSYFGGSFVFGLGVSEAAVSEAAEPSAPSAAPSGRGGEAGSNFTVESGCRKKEAPSDHVIVLPPSAQPIESAPMSVSFFTGTDGELMFTAGASPPAIGT